MVLATTITLISEEARGFFDTVSTTERKVFADVKDVGMNEYYVARSAGIAPEIVFELSVWTEYHGERLCDWESKRYKIVRTTRRGNAIRLICEREDVNNA